VVHPQSGQQSTEWQFIVGNKVQTSEEAPAMKSRTDLLTDQLITGSDDTNDGTVNNKVPNNSDNNDGGVNNKVPNDYGDDDDDDDDDRDTDDDGDDDISLCNDRPYPDIDDHWAKFTFAASMISVLSKVMVTASSEQTCYPRRTRKNGSLF
jgi:hypothetical protein